MHLQTGHASALGPCRLVHWPQHCSSWPCLAVAALRGWVCVFGRQPRSGLISKCGAACIARNSPQTRAQSVGTQYPLECVVGFFSALKLWHTAVGPAPSPCLRWEGYLRGFHRITVCLGVAGTSGAHLVQPPAQAGPPGARCMGPCSGGL